MKLLNCPMNGPRNISEFQYLGPVRPMPNPDAATDAEWTKYLFHAENTRGPMLEWWRHTPSNYVFVAERDTVSGSVLRTFDPASEDTQ